MSGCNQTCRHTTSYDVTSTAGQSNRGEVPEKKDVTARQLFNTSAVDVYVGFREPTNATGRWGGAFPLVAGEPTAIFESGNAIYFRPQTGTDAISITVVEETES